MNNDEFYIGWMEKAPAGFAKYIKKMLLILVVVVAITGLLLALSQKPFATGNFEFGKLTEIRGVYFGEPIPLLKAVNGKDIFGNTSFITIPLIGFGKSGVADVIAGIEKQKNIALNRKEVTMQGTLLYNDGKLLMQIDSKDSIFLKIGADAGNILSPVITDLGEQVIHGEIVDPKCFFGVMKPGEGKPHKDCAIRCILGGIPPVLKVKDEKGNENYYLVVGENGEKMNEAVKNFIAEPVTVHAKVVKYDDWIVLYIKKKGITQFSYLREHFGGAIASCEPARMK
ncbi:MAG: hypothetical protein ABJB86_22395 [Bacteroidota bacterium]